MSDIENLAESLRQAVIQRTELERRFEEAQAKIRSLCVKVLMERTKCIKMVEGFPQMMLVARCTEHSMDLEPVPCGCPKKIAALLQGQLAP